MSGQHTPGPWLTKPPRIGASITIYGGPDEVFPVATTCSNTSPATMQAHRDGTVAANARLIAAAPEMLDALRDILKRNEIQQWFNTDKARAAIAKATASTADAGVAG